MAIKAENQLIPNLGLEPVKCEQCEKTFDVGECTEYNGNYYCADCIEKHFVTCFHCDEIVHKDDAKEYDDENYCEDCFNDKFSVCDVCGNTYDSNDIRYSEMTDQNYCNDCYSQEFSTCNDCDDEIYIGSNPSVIRRNPSYTIHNGNDICESCLENYTTCEDCGELYHNDNMNYNESDECYYCYNCFEKHEGRAIMDHDYKPAWKKYYGKNEKESYETPFIGLEIEVENKSDRYDNEEAAQYIIDNTSIVDFCKRDGSLSNGFEIVTMPFSQSYYQQNRKDLFTAITGLSNKGFRSYDTETCGYHIHINRSCFVEVLHFYRFLRFFYDLKKSTIETIAQRSENQWCQYSKSDNTIRLAKTKNSSIRDDRYRSINLCNTHTVEIRIFKGTLKETSIKKNIEFAFSLIEFTRNASLNYSFADYADFVEDNKKQYPNLFTFLKENNLITIKTKEVSKCA